MDYSNVTKGKTNLPFVSHSSKCEVSQKNGAYLDTLAQVATKAKSCDCCEGDFLLKSVVSTKDKKTLQNRAGRKLMMDYLITSLVKSSELNGESGLMKPYWNTYHCCATLTVNNSGKVTGSYCKNRWCLMCNAIRTAELTNKYLPSIESWQNKHFVTLTQPNCEADKLPETIAWMQKVFTKIKRRFNKQAERGQRETFVGIRKMECTYNPERNDFHPHYHLIIDGQKNAEDFLACWEDEVVNGFWQYFEEYKGLSDISDAYSLVSKAQDIRPADDKSVKEMFKYFTKVISSKDQKRVIYADALDVIFNAIRNKRVFQPFGFKASDLQPVEEEQPEEEPKEDVQIVAEYHFDRKKHDWVHTSESVDYETGEVVEQSTALSGYKPTGQLIDLIENRIIVRKNWSKRANWKRYPNPEKLPPIKILKPLDITNDEKAFRMAQSDVIGVKNARIGEKYRNEQLKKKLLRQKAEELMITARGGSEWSVNSFNWKQYSESVEQRIHRISQPIFDKPEQPKISKAEIAESWDRYLSRIGV